MHPDSAGPRNLPIITALVFGTFALYARTATFGFVHYDDPDCVTRVPEVTAGLSWAGFKWAFQSIVVGHWKPIVSLSHMVDCEVFDLNAGGHHLVNVLWHAATAAMLFLALRAMTDAPWRSAMVAALFAWHPLRVESVAWITERKDVLSGFFAMLVLWAYARQVIAPTPARRAVVMVAFALGLMSKSSLVTLPFALLLLDVWPLRRLEPFSSQGAEAGIAPRRGVTLAAAIAEKMPLFVLSASASVIAFLAAKSGYAGQTPADSLSAGLRISNAAVACIEYLRQTVLPTGLAVFYPYVSVPAWKGTLAAAGMAGLTVWVFTQARRRPYLAVGWFWFLGMLTPMIGLVQSGAQSRADRYTYLAHIGLAMAVVWGVHDWARSRQRLRAAQGLFVAAVFGCAMGTLAVLPHWRNSFTLFERAAAVTRDNWTAHGNLGFLHLAAGRAQEAVPHLEVAVRTMSRDENLRFNLALALFDLGRVEEATPHLREVIRRNPGFAAAHRRLADALTRLQLRAEAAASLERAARLQPTDVDAWVDLGVLRAGLGDKSAAAGHYRRALALNPDHAAAHANLGGLLADDGRLDDAAPHLADAVRLQPTNSVARHNLALLLLRQSRDADAVAQLREAVRLQPDFGNALNRLAWALATSPEDSVRNSAEALMLARRVVHLTGGREPIAFDTLGAALAETGDFAEATRAASKASELATTAGRSALAAQAQARAELYRAGRPFRDQASREPFR